MLHWKKLKQEHLINVISLKKAIKQQMKCLQFRKGVEILQTQGRMLQTVFLKASLYLTAQMGANSCLGWEEQLLEEKGWHTGLLYLPSCPLLLRTISCLAPMLPKIASSSLALMSFDFLNVRLFILSNTFLPCKFQTKP